MNNFKINIKNLKQTEELAKKTASTIDKYSGGLLFLYGDIGAGKTTFVKILAKYLDIKEKVTSPSFVILNEYHSGKMDLYHFDLYRLEKEGISSIIDEIQEYTEDENSLTVVEWANYFQDKLPDERIEITVDYAEKETRVFSFNAFGIKSKQICKEIKESLKKVK